MLQADGDEIDPREQGEYRGTGHAGVGRHVEERDDLEDVADEDEEEKAREVRQVAEAIGPDCLHDDAIADETDRRLDEIAWSPGNEGPVDEGLAPCGENEDQRGGDQGHEVDERNLVEAVPDAFVTEGVGPLDQLFDCWELESEDHLADDSLEAVVGLRAG
ncbi:unannotated protein [freshwater metagenome]|uniref:Unannotated protein n=1 Tax=freshwater metagenome TaxID=449393 RepID=A0A6J6HX85_9ZZZZ